MLQKCSSSLLGPLKSFLINKEYCFANFVNSFLKVAARHKSTKPVYPPLEEDLLQEKHVKGFGPGGQAINKTNNCVVLKHLPTGIVIKCQQTRILEENRKLARRLMQQRLDWYHHRGQCQLEVQKMKESAARKKKKQQTREKLQKLQEFKEREGITK